MSATHTTYVSKLASEDPDCNAFHLIVVRQRRSDYYEIGGFLIDRLCLGVKDAFFNSCDANELEELKQKFYPQGDAVEQSGAWGRKYVESAVEYARKLGFSPHADYKKAARVFGGINAKECDQTFEFGKDGKPFYIQGPYEDEKAAERIIARLEARCGEDNYNYILRLGDYEDDSDDEDSADGEVEPERWFFAEQTGGGPPSERFKELADEISESLNYELDADYEYDPDSNYIAEITESFMQGLFKNFEEDIYQSDDEILESGEKMDKEEDEEGLRDFISNLTNTLLLLVAAPEAAMPEMIKTIEPKEQRVIILDLLADKNLRKTLSNFSGIYEGEINRILKINWSNANLTPDGKPRVEVFGLREYLD